jgi:hypothetical protein
MGKASDIAWSSGLGGGGPWVVCSCRKEHSLSDEEYQYDEFRYIFLDGVQFVEGCDGCDSRLARYESFIWENRQFVREYIRRRVERMQAEARIESTTTTDAGFYNEETKNV